MKYVQGLILQESSEDDFNFIEGYLGFDDGKIVEVEEGKIPSEINESDVIGKGVVLPTLANPHTHIGDSVAKGIEFPEPVTIESLLAPPDGLKHRILRESSETDLINAMKATLEDMVRAGISEFCDFREMGTDGVKQLKSAVEGVPINPVIFGRPSGLDYEVQEFNDLLTEVDGVGISAISDYDEDVLVKITEHTKKAGKGLALHVSERVREDLDKVLELTPDFLIHMTKGTSDDFGNLKEANVPVIICPRSNLFFGNTPDIEQMLDNDLTMALGTDNVMLNQPDIFQEMKAAYGILDSQWDRSSTETASEIFKMGIINGRKILNHKYNIPHHQLQVGAEAKFILIEIPYKDLEPTKVIVNEVGIEDISIISIGQFLSHGKRPVD